MLEGSRGPVPSLAEAIAGEPIRGSWWGHSKGKSIFWASRAVRDSRETLVCRLIGGKITYVHRRLWPALVRLAKWLDKGGLAALREAHTPSGAHKIRMVPFSRWVTLETRRQAERLSEEDARAQFGAWIDAYLHEADPAPSGSAADACEFSNAMVGFSFFTSDNYWFPVRCRSRSSSFCRGTHLPRTITPNGRFSVSRFSSGLPATSSRSAR